MTNIVATDIEKKVSLGSAKWSATIAAPLSGNANLSGLSCSNADLSPTFSSGTTEYSTTVPYSVSKLSLSVRTEDSGADYSVSGNDLSVGSNTVTVKVTAANGNTKRYYIYVTRQQDPNYVPSTDATLSELTISEGVLSPAFSSEVTDYVVYLPYESTEVSLSGVAHDSKAMSVTKAKTVLMLGENLVSIRCTAEDGITVLEYKVKVVRMPAYAGILPEIIAPDAEPVPEEEPPTMLETLWAALCLPVTLPFNRWLPVWAVAAIGIGLLLVILILVAYAIGRATGRRKAQRERMAVVEEETPALLTRLAEQLENEKQQESETKQEPETETEPAPQAEEKADEPVRTEEVPCESGPEESVAEEEPAAVEPATQEEPVVEAEVAEEVQQEPAPEEAASEETPVAEDVPAEEAVEDPVNNIPARPAETLEELGGMSLDDLLKDIRDM